MKALSIFLSHSHKDVEKIRKIRDLLELINCEPLMFYLKCLDDDNKELEDFIKREIDARNIFIYCKSKNAESSSWVQLELDYIRSIDHSRIYTIDIENGFEFSIVKTLYKISNIIRNNTIFIYVADNDMPFAEKLKKQCQNVGYNVFIEKTHSDGLPGMKQLECWDFQKIKLSWDLYFEGNLLPQIKDISKRGVFVLVTSESMCSIDWNVYMSGKVLNWFNSHPEVKMLKISPIQNITSILHQLTAISTCEYW